MKQEIKYDWFEFGVFGVFKADELPLHRDELKKYGQSFVVLEDINTILNLINNKPYKHDESKHR